MLYKNWTIRIRKLSEPGVAPDLLTTTPAERFGMMWQLAQVVPGLYCGGESAGGFNQHGLGRGTTQGDIAGTNAAAERPQA